MVLDDYTKRRILHYNRFGLTPGKIVKQLESDGDCRRVSREGIRLFLARYRARGTLMRKPGSGRPSKITERVKELVEASLRVNDETTATQLYTMLHDHGLDVSLTTIVRCREILGWTFKGSKYCQLIRVVNKTKRLEFARQHRHDSFDDVVWTDECSVQLERHARKCWRKRKERPKNKPRYLAVSQCPVCLSVKLYV